MPHQRGAPAGWLPSGLPDAFACAKRPRMSETVNRVLAMPPKPKSTSEAERDVPELRSLGPQYDQELHGRHADVLLNVLADNSDSAPKNIALAGHYGSGKSSVILGVQEGLDARNIKWVNLSLSSLGTDNTKRGRVQEDGTLAPLTNLIQKEIVKQLLYRKAPKDMPGSRYFRIDSFRTGRAVQWATAASVGVFALAVLLGLVGRVRKVAPNWLADGPSWAPWATVGLLGVFGGLLCFLALRGLQNPIKVDSVSAGGAAVSLSAKENSYFDEYLDEIVYFFQQTKTRVAIFEDLDRFKDPHIFETLRELNTVLNHSEQVKSRPVKFVYAVRDSIFEQLEVASNSAPSDAPPRTEPTGPELGTNPPAVAVGDLILRASVQESIPSANRTKFFDLVVPMVPFLTHRSARDLLAEEFETSPHKPSMDVINLIGGHRALTDMRLIRNIRNEFEIYQASVLSDQGLQGLTADRLFAMMVYKNTHLEDFEAIRHGTSRIDMAHRAFRQFVEHQSGAQASRSKTAMSRAQSLVPWDERAKAVGERLQQTLPLLQRANRHGRGVEPQVITSFGTYKMGDLVSADFWKKLHESRDSIDVGHPSYYPVTLSFDEFLMLGGDAGMAINSLVEVDVTELRRQAREALDTREFVTTATMAELMARTDLTMPVDGSTEGRTLDAIVSDIVSPLAHDLLAQGLLDENFTLYCSDYQGVAISVSAMNFILHCVQADQADPLFRFDDPSSIDAVESEVGERFLGGEGVFNVEVFDHYLTKNARRLDNALDRLVVRASSGATSFVDLYLEDEKVGTKQAFVAALAPRWPGVFTHLATASSSEQQVTFVDTALRCAATDVAYQASDALVALVSERYTEMGVFTEPLAAEQAGNLVRLLRDLDIQVSDLSVLGMHQRRAVVTAGLYPVTRANLLAALNSGGADAQGAADTSLALDALKARDNDVYTHVASHLNDYLIALAKNEVTVEDPDEFLGVLRDIIGAPEQLVRAVAERADGSCVVPDLAALDEAGWLPVVAAGRFLTSASNVSRYVGQHGVTPAMAQCLVDHDVVSAEDEGEEEKTALAYALVEAAILGPADRVRLVKQLAFSAYLEPSQLGPEGLDMLPELLAAGEVPDTAETYAVVASRPYQYREKYFASSPELASYVTELALSSDDLDRMMRSREVAHDVKEAIAAAPEFIAARISQRVAITICNWALKGNDISTALLLVLSKAGAPAEKILPLLEDHLSTVELGTLDAILLALGDDYEPLTRRGRHRPRLKSRPGTEELLEELKRRDRVSSYGDAMLGGVRVNMRA